MCAPCNAIMQVPVINSDLGFNLLYADNLSADLMRTLLALLAPFPQGLLTPVGGRAACSTS